MPNFPLRVQQVLDEGYEFRFGDYLSRGFQILNRNPGLFIAFLLLYLTINLFLAVIPIVGTLATFILNPPLSIGFYYAAHRLANDEPLAFNDFFRGFDKFGNLVLTSLLYALILIGASLPGLIILITGGVMSFAGGMGDDPFASMGSLMIAGLILALVPAIYFGISYLLAPLFVWFYDMEPWPALEASRKLVGRQWFSFFGFAVVVGLIGISGAILLLVGLLYTMPFVYCALYAAFADITRLGETESGEADVIEHFVPGI
jgi:hypothetical protein